jgi:hypothetical protein
MTQLAPAASTPPYALTDPELAEAAAYHLELHPALKCCATLRMSFFFDGTGNNHDVDLPLKRQSNVARLYDVFDRKPDIKSSVDVGNRFATYMAGVGTPFKKEVGDSGIGLQGDAGLAAGWGGESRIVWALLQLQNHVHYFHYGQTLSGALGYGNNELPLLMQSCQDQHVSVPRMNHNTYGAATPFVPPPSSTANVVSVSYDVANMHNYDHARQALLAKRAADLRQRVGKVHTLKPTAEAIHLSVFGFSRGAAEARVFLNWLHEAMDPGGATLGGIPLRVIFVGLFDTVASVGFSEAVAEGEITGHGGWAKPQNLVIPGFVEKCLHLTAAHEVRGSFPLDGANGSVEQYVYPGVHSDIGGGYAPLEQGRSPEDADKLSQIPLGHMYRAAVAAGVPLDMNASTVQSRAKDAMKASSALVSAFNAYVKTTQDLAHGGLVPIVRAHYGKYVSWRRLRLDTLPNLPATKRASPQDQRDLIDANNELREEARDLVEGDRNRLENEAFYTNNPYASESAPPHLLTWIEGLISGQKIPDWQQVKPYWDKPLNLTTDRALIELFDNYVHDSRATFKPLADDQAKWKQQQTRRMKQLQVRRDRYARWQSVTYPQGRLVVRSALQADMASIPPVEPLNEQEAADLDHYEKTGQLPFDLGGREFSLTWGYLRWRVIFNG